MIALDILWWIGLAWFAVCAASPLLLTPLIGSFWACIALVLLAPWTSLFGIALVHRLFPDSETGRFSMFTDSGSVHWALKGWGPSLFLSVFQPLCFLSAGFQRIALRAFQANMGQGSLVTSRTSIREPHHIHIGRGSLIGEHVHLACSIQPRPRLLIVGKIEIGADVLVGSYCHIVAGSRIGSHCILEHAVGIGPGCSIGENSRIGAASTLYSGVRVGRNVRIGKGCTVAPGTVINDGARIPDDSHVSGVI